MFHRTFPEGIGDGLLEVRSIPPIESVNIGRECGYPIRKLNSRGKEGISATYIRTLIRSDSKLWWGLVSSGTYQVIIEKLATGEEI